MAEAAEVTKAAEVPEDRWLDETPEVSPKEVPAVYSAEVPDPSPGGPVPTEAELRGGSPSMDILTIGLNEQFPPINWEGALAGQKALTQQKIEADERTFGLFSRRLEEDRRRQRQAYDATSLGPNELQPWNADAERQKYSTS